MKRILPLLVGALVLSSVAHGFGPEGHQLVGALAQARLAQTPAGRAQLAKALALLSDPADPKTAGLSLRQAGPMPDDLRGWDDIINHRTPAQLLQAYPTADAAPKVPDFFNPKKMDPFGEGWPQTVREQMWQYFVANSQPDQYESSQLQHHIFHFCDIAVTPGADLKYNLNKHGCNPHDIAHMIDYCAAVLNDTAPATGPANKVTKTVALVVLVHLLGDIHQPLHIGAAYFDADGQQADPDHPKSGQMVYADAGGNFLTYEDSAAKPKNLHSHWDTEFVVAAASKWSAQFKLGANPDLTRLAEAIVGAQKAATIPKGKTIFALAQTWAEESVQLSQQAHERLTFSDVEAPGKGNQIKSGKVTPAKGAADYKDWAAQQLQQRIPLAGDRLAWIIEHSKL